MYRQLIIIRKDLSMSRGKACAMVAHGSLAYFMKLLKDNEANGKPVCDINGDSRGYYWINSFAINEHIYEEWIRGIFTKTVCEAKNKNQLMKAVTKAEEMGLREGDDFFLIKDNCLTELEPEEIDEDGVGRTLTCIGFRPLPDDIAHEISRKYQLYK